MSDFKILSCSLPMKYPIYIYMGKTYKNLYSHKIMILQVPVKNETNGRKGKIYEIMKNNNIG